MGTPLNIRRTLGDMISEAFHAHYKAVNRNPEEKVASVSMGTSCKSSEWETVTGVNSAKDSFSRKK